LKECNYSSATLAGILISVLIIALPAFRGNDSDNLNFIDFQGFE
jgi:hypothetical protein